MVDQRTYAPFHQHFLIARLDMDVDGPDNTVHMVETGPAGYGDDDPYGLGLIQRSVPLRTESEGKQDYRWETQRGWKVVNPGSLNHVGTPVAYKLVPGAALPHMLPEDSPVLRTAEALRHTLWVTPYTADERWPCGPFPNQSLDRRRACRRGRPRTARSRTPTSCSGTSSASTTSRAWRTGRSCPWTRCRSG